MMVYQDYGHYDGLIMIFSVIVMVIKILVIYDGLSRFWSFMMVYFIKILVISDGLLRLWSFLMVYQDYGHL